MESKMVNLSIMHPETKEMLNCTVPESELLPMVRDDCFKIAVQSLIDNKDKIDEIGGWGQKFTLAAQSKEEYIEKVKNPNYFQQLVASQPENSINQNLFGFANHGGIQNGGTCWWHSRMQRAAIYLTYYNPSGQKPNKQDANGIIWNLMLANKVVEVPGFTCFRDFSLYYEEEIQKCLNTSQILEGIFLFAGIDGLACLEEVPAENLRKKMDSIFDEVNNNGLTYVKLQTPGIGAHAWIITEMGKFNPDENNGLLYRYKFIDSNYPSNSYPWFHLITDTKIKFILGDMGVPYLQRKLELKNMKNNIQRFKL